MQRTEMKYVVVKPGEISFPHGVKGVCDTMSEAYDYIAELRRKYGGSYSVVPTPVIPLEVENGRPN